VKSSDEGSHRLMLVGVRPLCFREAPSVRNGFLALAFSLLLFVFVFIPDVVQSSNSSGPPPTPVSSFGGLGWGELIAIGSFILGSILVLWLNRRRKVEKVIDKLHGAFEQVPEKEPEIVLTEKIKREFFLGHYRQSYWTYIGLGLVCTRDLKKKMEDRMNLIDEKHWPPKIEIVVER
jgi:hypothetical protein